MERKAAAQPGTLSFIRPVCQDGTDRPDRFEAGVQNGENMLIDIFTNTAEEMPPDAHLGHAAIRPLPYRRRRRRKCVDTVPTGDSLFAIAWRGGAASLTRTERCAMAGVTGHVAESVTEVLLDRIEWRVLWHFTGPRRHGVDLVFLTPDDEIVAVEVKGTLVPGRIPRLSRRDMTQMSTT
jgi:hypothetical protein